MKYFVGLDVSHKSTSVCIVDEQGAIHAERKVDTDLDALSGFLRKADVHIERVGLEAGRLSAWLSEGLDNAGWPIVVLEARHLNGVLKTQLVKTDRNDARGIAQAVRTGWYRAVHRKSRSSQEVRALLAYRESLVHIKVKLTNQLRGLLCQLGLKVGQVTHYSYAERVRDLLADAGSAALSELAERLLAVRENVFRELLEVEKLVLQTAREDEVVRLLMTAPGIGPVTALAFRAAIDDPNQFKNSRQVGAFLGLTPKRYASGEMDFAGRITKCGDQALRTLLFECASVLLARVKRPCGIRIWAMKIAKRSCRKKAVVALARKLAVILHRMWVTGKPFEWHTVEITTGA